MKKIRLMNVVAALMATLVFASCSEEVTSVAPVIAEDAIFAAKLNLKSIYDKSFGDGSAQSAKVMNALKSALQTEEMPQQALNILNKALENPMAAFGLNLDQPVYLSATMDAQSEEAGIYLTASVSDRTMLQMILEKSFAQVEKETQTEKEYLESSEWYDGEYHLAGRETIQNGGKFYYFGGAADNAVCCALTDNALIFYMSAKSLGAGGVKGKAAIEKLLSQKGVCQGTGIDKFMAAQDDMNLWLDVETFMEKAKPLIRRGDASVYMMLKQFEAFYKGMSLTAALDFQAGRTVVNMSATMSEELKEQSMKYYTQPTDKYFSYIPASSLVAANLACNTAPLQEMWNELSGDANVGSYIQALKSFGIDERFVAGLPGTITAGLSVGMDGEPAVSLVMECDRKVYDVLMLLLVQHSGMVEDNGDGTYSIFEQNDYDDYDYDYGYGYLPTAKNYIGSLTYTDGAIVAMTSNLWNQSNGGRGFYNNYRMSSTADDIAKGGIALNLESLDGKILDTVAKEMSEALRPVHMSSRDLLDYCTSVTITNPDMFTSEISMNMGDKEHNLLQKFVALLSDTIR